MKNGQTIEELKSTLSNFNKWSRLATLAIFVGIMVEIIVLLIFSHTISWWEKGALLIGNALIAGGLWAEYVLMGKEEEIGDDLQMNSDETIARLGLDFLERRLIYPG